MVGWLVGWLVGNAVFLRKGNKNFSNFCMKLGDYKVKNWQSRIFEKKFLIWRYSRKDLQISPKSETDIFVKNGSNDFVGFWPEVSNKYDLQFERNLFFRKPCNLEIFDLKIVKILPKLRFLAIFSTLHY